MNKDWDRPKNIVSPIWNNGYGRYDLSIDDVVQKIKDIGYNLEEVSSHEANIETINNINERLQELENTVEDLIIRIQELENKLL